MNPTKTKTKRIALLAAVLGLAALTLGADSCERYKVKDQTKIRFSASPTVEFSRYRDHVGVIPEPTPYPWSKTVVTEFCTDDQKVICDWNNDPNVPRVFEYTNSTNGHNWSAGGWGSLPIDVENTVRCVQGRTAAGICEDHGELVGGNQTRDAAVTVGDIGACSSSLPLGFFVQQIASEFQKQADLRLGEQRPPEGEDVALWLDFVSNLKAGDWPVEAFIDTSIDDARNAKSEFVMRASYRVDGGIEWNLEPYWLGDKPGSQILAGAIEVTLLGLGWPAIFFGDCEKDRPMTVNIRGAFEATADGRGIGIRPNQSADCGPNGDWPCTWASVLDWPARPICNNQIKPKIESGFVAGVIAGFLEPQGGVNCLTCKADGGSVLPWVDRHAQPLPIERVEIFGGAIHFIHFDNIPTDPTNGGTSVVGLDQLGELATWNRYLEMRDDNKCGLDRAVPPVSFDYVKHGEHL